MESAKSPSGNVNVQYTQMSSMSPASSEFLLNIFIVCFSLANCASNIALSLAYFACNSPQKELLTTLINFPKMI